MKTPTTLTKDVKKKKEKNENLKRMIVLMLQGRVGSTNQQAKTKTWLYSISRDNDSMVTGTLNVKYFWLNKKKIFIPLTERHYTTEEEGDELLLPRR